MKDFLKTYMFLHRNRASWYHLGWRAAAIVAALIGVVLINIYLSNKYFVIVPEYGFILGEKFFYWFMIGFIAGIIAVSALFEGEFILGVRNITRELKHEEFLEALKPPRTGKPERQLGKGRVRQSR